MARPDTSTSDLAVLPVLVRGCTQCGEHLSVPGARPADSAMPKEDFASTASRTHETRCLSNEVEVGEVGRIGGVGE